MIKRCDFFRLRANVRKNFLELVCLMLQMSCESSPNNTHFQRLIVSFVYRQSFPFLHPGVDAFSTRVEAICTPGCRTLVHPDGAGLYTRVERRVISCENR